jgi:cytochrome P450 family 142 subfamily A polypeptide 1
VEEASIRSEIRLLDGAFYAADPHRHFSWLRRHEPVYWDPSSEVWGIALHEDVTEVSRRRDRFCSGRSSRPDAPPIPSMINLDDPQHRRRRGLVSKGFTPRRVAAHEPRIRALCRTLLARARERERFDFVHEVAAPLPMEMIGDLLGIEPEDRAQLQRWSDDLIAGTSASAPPAALAAAIAAFGEWSEYARRVIDGRRRGVVPARSPTGSSEDLMSVLVRAEIDGERLSEEDLIQEGLLILVGGNETTRHVLTGGCEALLRHPDQRRWLAEDPARIPAAVEEMLRWVTPIQNMNRTATADVVLRGRTIRAGDKVLLLYPSANRDERVFAEPFRFDVRRDPNPHLAFGIGAHFCLGASLARLELRVLFEELLAMLPDLELVSDAPLAASPSNFIRGIPAMEVALTRAGEGRCRSVSSCL